MEADIYPLVFVLTEVGCSLMSSAARVWAGVGLWRRWSRTGFGGDGESTKQKWGLLSPPLSSAPLPSHTHTHTSWHLNRPSVLGMQDHRLCFFFISLLSLFEYVLHDEGSTGECRHRLVGGSQLQFKVNTWLFEDTSSCWGSGWSAVTVSVLRRHFEVQKNSLRCFEPQITWIPKYVSEEESSGKGQTWGLRSLFKLHED